jgi:hypothetical protein
VVWGGHTRPGGIRTARGSVKILEKCSDTQHGQDALGLAVGSVPTYASVHGSILTIFLSSFRDPPGFPQQANRMNTNRFLPRWHYVENYINAMVGEENDNENDGTPQDDTREVRQQEHLPPMSPALTNTEPNINNLQIHELMKMQSNIRQTSNTCEPNETRLLNEHPLTKHLIEQDLHTIVEKCCTIPITQQVVWTPRLPTCNVTAFQLSRLKRMVNLYAMKSSSATMK